MQIRPVSHFTDQGGCRQTPPCHSPERQPGTLPVPWIDGDGERELRFSQIDLNRRFEAHPGWASQIEREQRGPNACVS